MIPTENIEMTDKRKVTPRGLIDKVLDSKKPVILLDRVSPEALRSSPVALRGRLSMSTSHSERQNSGFSGHKRKHTSGPSSMRNMHMMAPSEVTPRTLLANFIAAHDSEPAISKKRQRTGSPKKTPPGRPPIPKATSGRGLSPKDKSLVHSPRSKRKSIDLRKKATMKNFLQKESTTDKPTPRSMITNLIAQGLEESMVASQKIADHSSLGNDTNYRHDMTTGNYTQNNSTAMEESYLSHYTQSQGSQAMVQRTSPKQAVFRRRRKPNIENFSAGLDKSLARHRKPTQTSFDLDSILEHSDDQTSKSKHLSSSASRRSSRPRRSRLGHEIDVIGTDSEEDARTPRSGHQQVADNHEMVLSVSKTHIGDVMIHSPKAASPRGSEAEDEASESGEEELDKQQTQSNDKNTTQHSSVNDSAYPVPVLGNTMESGASKDILSEHMYIPEIRANESMDPDQDRNSGSLDGRESRLQTPGPSHTPGTSAAQDNSVSVSGRQSRLQTPGPSSTHTPGTSAAQDNSVSASGRQSRHQTPGPSPTHTPGTSSAQDNSVSASGRQSRHQTPSPSSTHTPGTSAAQDNSVSASGRQSRHQTPGPSPTHTPAGTSAAQDNSVSASGRQSRHQTPGPSSTHTPGTSAAQDSSSSYGRRYPLEASYVAAAASTPSNITHHRDYPSEQLPESTSGQSLRQHRHSSGTDVGHSKQTRRSLAEGPMIADISDLRTPRKSVGSSANHSESSHMSSPNSTYYKNLQTPVLSPDRSLPRITDFYKSQRKGGLGAKRTKETPEVRVPVVAEPTRRQSKKGNSKAKKSLLPRIPRSVTKSLVTHFTDLRLPKETLAVIEDVADSFFKNAVFDLAAYTKHAHRQTVDESDVELLMKRQGFVTDRQPLYALVEKHLPLEHRQEIIPMARFGNKVVPKI